MKDKWRVRLGVLIFIIGMGLTIMAAAPTESNYVTVTASQTIDSVFYGNGWEQVAALIFAATDSAAVCFEITGLATMGPRDRLYVGLGNDSANQVSATDFDPVSNLDTFLIQKENNLSGFEGIVPFHIRYIHAVVASVTDTLFLNAAVGEKGVGQVAVTDVVFSAQVWNDTLGSRTE